MAETAELGGAGSGGGDGFCAIAAAPAVRIKMFEMVKAFMSYTSDERAWRRTPSTVRFWNIRIG